MTSTKSFNSGLLNPLYFVYNISWVNQYSQVKCTLMLMTHDNSSTFGPKAQGKHSERSWLFLWFYNPSHRSDISMVFRRRFWPEKKVWSLFRVNICVECLPILHVKGSKGWVKGTKASMEYGRTIFAGFMLWKWCWQLAGPSTMARLGQNPWIH